jgi:hypothetical protein
LVHGSDRWRLQVHECCRTIEEGKSSNVRAAGAEGFGPAFSGVNAEDAGNDEDERAKDGQTWDKDVKCT